MRIAYFELMRYAHFSPAETLQLKLAVIVKKMHFIAQLIHEIEVISLSVLFTIRHMTVDI